MKSIAQKLIILSFILALITSITVFLYLKSLRIQNEGNKKTKILVAVEAIPPRTLIDKKMIKEMEVTDTPVFGNSVKDASKIIGKYTKESISKNEVFYDDNLLDKNEDELSLKIDSNHRAISISVTGDSGVSDLLKPEDFVDVITYIGEKKDGARTVNKDMAKIILQNIEVLAVDKKINREENIKNKAAEKEKTLTNFLVTLSVSSSEIEKLVLAESIGSIKLVLRPLKEDVHIETKGTTLKELAVNEYNKGDFTGENVVTNNNEKYTSYTVKQGDTLKKISKEFYGDESRFTIIKEANNIPDDLILTGEIVKIPIVK
ncbi:pilus assembly protein CpaB [Clostridium cavendishii DSM 21758]|uniref:Pilus assembly protein CpaB n=1 Tax=Clostridium cavendishii DSM 21758 TaxID=1121302 RepID=A0A1M6FE58_9CLOT|nr:Flp pilus assembly protein CpaB [Clostridium cavendishii]SHI95967.1 pilus assembly protein CpaB [Clostridium cavendishii DSM 21758]